MGAVKETYFGITKGNAFLEREFKRIYFENAKGYVFWKQKRERVFGDPKGSEGTSVPRELCSRVRVREHLSSDKSSHIFKHLQDLQSSEPGHKYCSTDSFEILNSASRKVQLKLKEATYAHQLGKAQFKSKSQSLQFNT